jgi:hypothetical protein
MLVGQRRSLASALAAVHRSASPDLLQPCGTVCHGAKPWEVYWHSSLAGGEC